jgi:hypothetical protein
LRPPPAKYFKTPGLKKTLKKKKKKKKNRAGGVAQGEGPEFKLQCGKKKEKDKNSMESQLGPTEATFPGWPGTWGSSDVPRHLSAVQKATWVASGRSG